MNACTPVEFMYETDLFPTTYLVWSRDHPRDQWPVLAYRPYFTYLTSTMPAEKVLVMTIVSTSIVNLLLVLCQQRRYLS